MIKLKRIYEPVSKDDGYRILVDRLWPRGISKEKSNLDLWLKDIAPSDSLRKWFGHDPAKWFSFKKKYSAELSKNKESFNRLKNILKKEKDVTLLYAAKDEKHNQALFLKELLESSPQH